jgi:pyruvate/2-oxoglutarate dehydrogenase complex dihydrolipoamide dehydrogenase (E3) component
VPEIPGLDQVDYLTNSSMMDIDFLPPHLVVLGGSYVGLEFGQMYRRFGSEVTIIELGPRVTLREDKDVSEAITGFLGKEGITVRANANCLSVTKRGSDIVLTVDCDGTFEVRGSHLLIATGRRPNTDDLGLEGEIEGFMKMFIDADTKEILGASFLGTAGDEVIHCVLDVMYAKAPYTVIERAVHIHPTIAEFIPGLLQDLTPLPTAPGDDKRG